MRVYEGQRSDKVAIKRTREEKKRVLAKLREELSMLKPTVSPALRAAMEKRIAEYEGELGEDAAAVQSFGPAAGRKPA